MSFTYVASASDWVRILPLLVLAGMGLITLLADLFLPQGAQARLALKQYSGASIPFSFLVLPFLSILGIAGSLAATIVLYASGDHLPAFYGMLASDQGTLYAYIIILSAAFLAVLLSPGYIKRQDLIHQGEYYALLLLATIGMMILAAAQNFLTVFVGIELLSLALYILCGYVARRSTSQESGMKYFLLSSFASAFLLYGLSLIYGATGSTAFSGVQAFLKVHSAASTLLFIGMGLLTVGFAFKVSAIPFHTWTPDVYQGAPAPVTAFMSVGTKAAAIIAFARVFTIVLQPLSSTWVPAIWAITVLTIVGGNVLAVAQKDVKRMLAYSSIAHAGYLLMGIVAGSNGKPLGMSSILFYLLCYAFLNTGAFAVVAVLERRDNSGTGPAELRGLWRRQPWLAGLLAFFLFGLAGFPPMAGFAAKYYIFYSALVSGHPELLVIGVVASILGMYYYLRPIATMFMEGEEVEPASSQVSGALPAIPASPRRRSSGRLSTSGSGSTATAVAVKTAPAATRKVTPVEEPAGEPEAPTAWPTGIVFTLAVLGTLALGTILPFWLISLAQQAASMM
ncbi:MAG TPA: NADH-quinone oxidoreductase subunit NuoN [Ktedonobacteraceae bacterium]|nr:NADH-quinone oxidoreductase subunit NuoN [Ktedonobacteraceae bacterium]